MRAGEAGVMTAAFHSLERTDCESRAKAVCNKVSEGLQSHSCDRDALGFRDTATVLAWVFLGPEGLSARTGDVWGGSKGAEG